MPIITDKSRKWIITIFMSVLIVAFALPSYFGQGGQRRDIPVATAFGENINESEIEMAKRDWSLFRSRPLMEGAPFPLTCQLFLNGDIMTLAQMDMGAAQQSIALAQAMESMIANDPKLYALLLREATRQGITPSPDRVDSLLFNQVRLPENAPQQERLAARQACARFATVQAAIQQATLAIQVSQPFVQSAMATQLQALSVDVVLFDANEFRAAVPPPDDATLQKLYDAHRNQLPNAPVTGEAATAATNYGFGYRQTEGVRLEYIALSSAELTRAAKASKTAHDWDVEGNKYYLRNQAQFTRLPPPTTSPTTQQSPASTQPIQQTYAEVRDQILAQLYDNRVEQLRSQVERRLTQLLSADYRQYAEAKLKNATPPATSVNVPVGSFEYLRAIAAKIEKETSVLPEVTSFGDRYLDAETFKREEIGTATLAGGSPGSAVPLGEFLLARTKPFFEAANPARRDPGATALEVLEPTPVFTSNSRPVIVARVLGARTASTLTLADVKDQVREDAIQQAATEAARKAAESFLATVTTSLSDAAAAAKRKVISAPDLRNDRSSLPSEIFTLSPTSQFTFIKGAFDLLRGDEKTGRARAVISLPRDRKVAVVEVKDTKPLRPGIELARLQLGGQYSLRNEAVTRFLVSYLSPDAIIARTQYVDLTGRTKPAATQPEPEKN